MPINMVNKVEAFWCGYISGLVVSMVVLLVDKIDHNNIVYAVLIVFLVIVELLSLFFSLRDNRNENTPSLP